MEERRQHARVSVDVTVEVTGPGSAGPFEGTMRDVSLGGAFLRLQGRLAQGARIDVRVAGDADQAALPALVCRVALNGVGVAWDDPNDAAQQVIAALLARAS